MGLSKAEETLGNITVFFDTTYSPITFDLWENSE